MNHVYHLQLNLHQAASTLGVPASGRLMEVGRSIEARHTLQNIIIKQKLLFILSQTRYSSQSSPSTSDCIFLLHILETKRN